jgi:hypothetical protein
MLTARRINGQGADGIAALVIFLGTPQHQNMLETGMAVAGHRGTGLVAQKGQLGGGILPLAEGIDFYAGAEGLPGNLPLALPNGEQVSEDGLSGGHGGRLLDNAMEQRM